MLSMNNKEIYFAHKVSLSRLNSKLGYPDLCQHDAQCQPLLQLRKSVLTALKFLPFISETKKYFQKLTT